MGIGTSLEHLLAGNSIHLLLYTPLFTVVLFFCYAVYLRTLHPLAGVPGPFSASISKYWLVKRSRNGKIHRDMVALHQKYGPIVRTGPNEVSISDPSVVKTIYGAGSKFSKSQWYLPWQTGRKFHMFAEIDREQHAFNKRLVVRAFSVESLKDVEPGVDEIINTLVRQMDRRLGQEVDLSKWLQFFAFDAIGQVTFSQSFNFLDKASDDGLFEGMSRAFHFMAWVGQVPWLVKLNRLLTPYIGNWTPTNIQSGAIRDLAISATQARKDRGSERKDILGKLFACQKDRPQDLNDEAVIGTAMGNIFAGSDTTAISLRAIIFYLLKNPQYLERLRADIKAHPHSDPIQSDEAEQMPYLQAVMYEALRCFPAVGMNLARVVPAGGLTVGSTYISEGTDVGVNGWVIHADKDIYGEDADQFRPDRWIDAEKGNMLRHFLAFGAGARSCLGKNISWMEMSKLVPTLLMRYDMELVDPDAELIEDNAWFVLNSGLNVKMTRRP